VREIVTRIGVQAAADIEEQGREPRVAMDALRQLGEVVHRLSVGSQQHPAERRVPSGETAAIHV
jgi:hypothetical protein